MSELGSIIEYATDVADAEAPKALPANDYPAEIIGAELKQSKTGNLGVQVQWRIKPEDFPADYEDAESFADGKTVSNWVNAEGDRRSMFRMRRFLEAIGAPLSKQIDVNEWIGRTAVLTIQTRSFEGVDQEDIRSVQAK